jgi:hypothetical protein
MLPSTPELLDLVSSRRRAREAEAAAERLRPSHGTRLLAAALLRRLADRLAPAPSGAPADGRLAHR